MLRLHSKPALCALPLLAISALSAGLPSCAIVDSVSRGVSVVGRFARGIARGEGEVKDGKQEGEWTYLSEGDRIRARGKYENDIQVGVWTYYYENGQKELEGELVGQRRVGRYHYWHTNGSPRATGSFVAGREFGEWTFWTPRGGMSQRGSFWNGLRHGLWTSFHPAGGVAARGLYFKGEQVGRWELTGPDGTKSTAWTPLPSDVEWIEDRWDDGTARRTGFRRLGRPMGLWTLYHGNGDPRLVGEMTNGVPTGVWTAFGTAGTVLAQGNVAVGRASGLWRIATSSGAMTEVDGAGFPLSMPFQGQWSSSDLAQEAGIESALGVWLSEIAAPVDEALIADHSDPGAEERAATAAAEIPDADVPVVAQPWTSFELSNYDTLVSAYRTGGSALKKLRSRYARLRSAAPAIPEPGGDKEAANEFVGKPLKLSVFKNQEGEDFDLATLRGHKVVLVILRGYSGQVCVYCTAQTQALCEEGAFEEFERLGAKLQVLFPGEKNGLDAFKTAYDSLSSRAIPPYGLLYENDYIVGPLLGIEGSKVIPTTFILDEQGIVRFAYLGKSKEDRPAVKLLIEELERLNANE